MCNTAEHAFKEKSAKLLILLPLRTIYFGTFQCEIPCIFFLVFTFYISFPKNLCSNKYDSVVVVCSLLDTWKQWQRSCFHLLCIVCLNRIQSPNSCLRTKGLVDSVHAKKPCSKDLSFLPVEMVFCYQNCSDLL